MTLSRVTQAVVIACMLSSCAASYEDVSTDPAYRSLIGQELRCDSELLLHEVTLDLDSPGRVDTCSVTPPPGFDGPEVVRRSVVPAGTTFRVEHVRRCTNCLGDEIIELVVSSPAMARCGQAPITISSSFLASN
jgi:hypothetical protein